MKVAVGMMVDASNTFFYLLSSIVYHVLGIQDEYGLVAIYIAR